MSEQENKSLENNKLSSDSSIINYSKKYSNIILPTVGGIVGFLCMSPIVSLAGGGLATFGFYSALKTTTIVAGTGLATIGGNKINTSLINSSSWNDILTKDELNQISQNVEIYTDINKFYKYFSESLHNIDENNYILYKRYETVYRKQRKKR